MNESLAFIICTEKGYLERMSLLFARSLRTYGGKFKDAPIYSYAPRVGKNISKKTAEQFASLNVIHFYLPLNEEFSYYAIANKVFVLSHAEKTLDFDILVFIDSDMLILSEPTDLQLSPEHDIALRPVGSKGVGIRDEKDPEYDYWQRLYAVCNVEQITYTETTIDVKRIQGYWNSGLMAVRRKSKIYSQWETNLLQMLRSQTYPKNGIYFTEQSTFSATIMGMKARLVELPGSYNYPIHRQNILLPNKKINDLGGIVTAHYHDLFRKIQKYGQPHPLADFQKSEPQLYRWLIENLDKYGVYSSNYVKRLSMNILWDFQSKLQRLKARFHF
jgi:hypothetical protein